ncbi:MAG TPA: VIT domain-containing protein, partial [Gemmatimonadales bacterium]|nr:VIT domain-containing protein [Gemmatimonadales bacterium]
MRRSKLGHLLALALFLAPAGSLAAQGWIEVAGATPAGRIEKVRGAVDVTITGRVARVTVEEWFRNAGPVVNEGAYLYALPGESVFSDFSLWQGDHELKGEVMDAAQARGIYEEIVRRRRDPALI